jgi:hypothetical protein
VPRTFYVDFDGGSDDHDGISPQAPFKHSPGDPAAGGNAQAAVLRPGDTVLFRGSVVYRGSIVVSASGAAGQPIVFDGNFAGVFGKGRAIIDGSDELLHWEPCRSADECGGNPNWKHIHSTWLDAPVEPLAANLFQGDRMCWLAQDPDPEDPFYQDRPEGHRRVSEATANTITDPEYLTQPQGDAWNDALLVVYARPHYPYFVKVTGYDPRVISLSV